MVSIGTQGSMMKKVALCLALFGLSSACYAEYPTEEDLWDCYDIEFQHDTITPDVAYSIGQCFSDLAALIDATDYHGIYGAPMIADISNKNVVLNYADSWFMLAVYKGHPSAQNELATTRYQLDGQ